MSAHEFFTTALTLALLYAAGRHGWQDGKKNSR